MSADIKVPRNQKLWESIYSSDNKLKAFVTSNLERTKYYKYEVGKDGTVTKTATADSPKEF